jgi:hypothetical protein
VALGLSALDAVQGTLFQVGASAQAVVDAVQAGDGVTALSALLNGPAEITGAFLNGVPSQGLPGILSPSIGLLNVLAVQIPQQIAQALGALAPMATLAKFTAVKDPSELPSVAPKMVTLPTPAKVNVPAVGSGPIAKLLARFYEPTHGRITIDGVDLNDVSQASLRRQLGVVLVVVGRRGAAAVDQRLHDHRDVAEAPARLGAVHQHFARHRVIGQARQALA